MDPFQQSIYEVLTGKGAPNAFQRVVQWSAKNAIWVVPFIAWLFFWGPVVFGQAQLFARDLTFYALPLKSYMMERLWQGQFPMWTPRLSNGMPFFAELSNQVLYPLNFLYWLTGSAVQGVSWQIILEHLIGFWTMGYLARTLGFSKWTCVWVSLVYGFSGYMLGIMDNINYHPAVAWVPLMLTFFIQGIQRIFKEVALPWRWLVMQSTLTSLPMALLIFAGDTFSPLFLGIFATTSVIGLSIYWLMQYKKRALRPISQLWLHWFISFAFVFAICAIQILPSWELMQYSVRQNMLEYSEVTLWSFPWERLVEFVVPYLFGSRFPEPQFIGMFLYPAFREPWADSVYVGGITLFLAGVGLFFTRGFFRWLFAWMLILAIVLAAGANASYYPLLVKLIPILQTQRYLEKFIFFSAVAIPLLAGFGVEVFKHYFESFKTFWDSKSTGFKMVVTVGIFIGLNLLIVQLPAQAWIWSHYYERSMDWGSHFYGREQHVAWMYLHFFLILIPILGLLWVSRTLLPFYFSCLLCIGVVDLVMVHYPHFPTAPSALLRDRPTPVVAPKLHKLLSKLEFSQPTGTARVYYDDMVDGTDSKEEPRLIKALVNAYNLPYLTDTYAFQWIYRVYYNQERLLFNYGLAYGFNYQNGRFAPLQPKLHKQMDVVLTQEAPELLMALSGVHYVITPIRPQNAVWERPEYREVYRDPGYNLKIMSVDNTLPRAYVAPNTIMNTEPQNMYMALVDTLRVHPLTEWAEISPLWSLQLPERQQAYENDPKSWIAEKTVPLKINEHQAERIEVEVNSPYAKPSPLVVTESWFPGWQAILDDKTPVQIQLANHRFLSVMVPSGKHKVRFEYHSTFFMTGLWISLVSMLWAGFVLFRKWRSILQGL